MYTLNATGVHGIAYTFNPSAVRLGNNVELSQVTQTLLASQAKNGDNQPLVLTAHAFEPGSVARNAGPSGISDVCPTLRADMGDNKPAILQQPAMSVRRLTPTECERLQGFPDNYTNIPFYRRKGYVYPERYGKYHHPDGCESKLVKASDSARYKALGNSMAIPVISWVGRRIQMCSDILKSTR
jgi:DNA (cytosine-5)-methyltransferase 1